MNIFIHIKKSSIIISSIIISSSSITISDERASVELQEISKRYKTSLSNNGDGLLKTGTDIYKWIEKYISITEWKCRKRRKTLEIRVDNYSCTIEKILMDVPWEVLADDSGFLVDDEKN